MQSFQSFFFFFLDWELNAVITGRIDVIFLSFVLQVVSIVPVSKHESDSWEKIKVIILSGFLFIF